MKYITLFNLLGRIIYIPLVFILIKSPADYLLVPIINGIISVVIIMVSSFSLFKYENIKLKFVSVKTLFYYCRESFDFFLSNSMVFIKEKTNIFVLGTFVSMRDVALYDFVQKVTELFRMPFMMFRDAIFPNFAKSKSLYRFKSITKWVFILGWVIYFVGIWSIPFIEELIGGSELHGSIKYFSLIGLFIPLGILSMYLGTFLILAEKRKFYRNSIVLSVLFYIVGLICLFAGGKLSNVYLLIVVFLISLLVEIIYRLKRI